MFQMDEIAQAGRDAPGEQVLIKLKPVHAQKISQLWRNRPCQLVPIQKPA
jgi:hypothetical protein